MLPSGEIAATVLQCHAAGLWHGESPPEARGEERLRFERIPPSVRVGEFWFPSVRLGGAGPSVLS
jgi:hypothetical protein